MRNVLIAALMLAAVAPAAGAQTHEHAAPATGEGRRNTPQQNDLVNIVREATRDFRNVSAALEKGYGLMFGCVSGGDYGAMGLHFVNGGLVFDGEIDAAKPEIVLYEPLPGGRVRITGADYLVIAADWHAKNPSSTPELNGQLFHYFEAPNRFGLPPFYTLHVWAWKTNPAGTFSNWNPNVSCDNFNPGTPPAAR